MLVKNFESVMRHAIERSFANNSEKREDIYNRARNALNEWFVDNPMPTNERLEQLRLLEDAIEETEYKLRWMQVAS
jgi:hypothetical protein